MRYAKFILLFCFLFGAGFAAPCQTIQRYNTFSYNVNEGLLQSTIGDVEFDKKNYCWISFPNGIQKFDGKNFSNVPVQPGLPDDKFCSFFKCSNGVLLIGHTQGISRYDADGNKFIVVYNAAGGSQKFAQFIGEEEGIIYFYSQQTEIIGISLKDYSVLSVTKTGFPDFTLNYEYRPKTGDNIIGHHAVFMIRPFIYLWDLKNKKLLKQSPSIPNLSIFFLHMKNENEVYYYTYKEGSPCIELYNFGNGSNKTLSIKANMPGHIGRFLIHQWDNKHLISINDRLFETDSLINIKAEIVNFQNQPVALGNAISSIKEDNSGNLYLQTITGGIKKIIRNNYPIKYYNSGEVRKNFVMAVLPDKANNRILTGLQNNGIAVYDTLQQLVKHIKFANKAGVTISPNVIIKQPNGNYLIFVQGEQKVWELSHDLSGLKSVPMISHLPEAQRGANYFSVNLMQSDKEAIVQQEVNLFRITFSPLRVSEQGITTGYTMGGLYYPPFIITHTNDELIFLDAKTSLAVKKIPFKNTGNVRCFATDKENKIHAGTNKGIFVIDTSGNILQHYTKATGLPDECIYAMAFDDENNLWCSTNKGILKLKNGKVVQQLKKEDGLQENEFNTNIVAAAADGELFFGGVNGVSSFYPPAVSSHDDKLNLFFTGIRANGEEVMSDTAAWNISTIKLPYDRNALSFDFIAMGNSNPDQYIYQYRMNGADKEWIQKNDLQAVRYSLPPGKYTFQVYASRSFDKDAKPLKEIRIIIQPPVWQSWWFISVTALGFFGLLAYLINGKNKRKYEKKLQQLENERQLKEERERISKDLHDSIGAYANAVLYNTELLEKEEEAVIRGELMQDLKFASKDIIIALRETIWALKKDNYSAQDCLMRIRNFLQPFTRYYQHITFTVEGEAPADRELHYTKALNVVRIVQEAVTNAIKHADTKNIFVKSDPKENKWEITVSDDGKGFDEQAMPDNNEGNGLGNMKKRAEESAFDFSVISRPGSGTSIRIGI